MKKKMLTFTMDNPVYGYEPADVSIFLDEYKKHLQRENELDYVHVCTDLYCMYTNHQEILPYKRATCRYCGKVMQLSGRVMR